MALTADHTAKELLAETGARNAARPGADRAALKCRPAPSRRAPATTMPYAVCLRLAGAWAGGLVMLLAAVLTIRWMG